MAIGRLNNHHSLDLAVWPLFGDPGGNRCTSAPTSIWWTIRLHEVETPIPDHDVSGTGWQTLGRAKQSITTMIPVWQCGHSRNDSPVSASNRSR